jgi:hypothetical protein
MPATTTRTCFYITEILTRVRTIVRAPASTITFIGCIKRKRRCAHILVADDPDSRSAIYIGR